MTFGDSAQCAQCFGALGRQPKLVVPPVGAAAVGFLLPRSRAAANRQEP